MRPNDRNSLDLQMQVPECEPTRHPSFFPVISVYFRACWPYMFLQAHAAGLTDWLCSPPPLCLLHSLPLPKSLPGLVFFLATLTSRSSVSLSGESTVLWEIPLHANHNQMLTFCTFLPFLPVRFWASLGSHRLLSLQLQVVNKLSQKQVSVQEFISLFSCPPKTR